MTPVWFQAILLVVVLGLSASVASVLPVLMQLQARLRLGTLQWPGPASDIREWPPLPLFPALVRDVTILGVTAACLLVLWLGETPLLAGVLGISWPWGLLPLSAFLLLAGTVEARGTLRHAMQVRGLLAAPPAQAEPLPAPGGEAELSIAHPLLVHGGPGGYRDQALGHFVQGTWLVQAGQVRQGELLCQQGLELDPFLHRHAREGLRRLGQRCDPRETGAIYFWLGVHSEALWDFKQAGEWYELAVAEFEEMGARVRESRARCSLGSIKLKLRDESGPQEFERAAALHPGNGAAHLNIGRLYYAAGQPGDAGYERALDEFACAMAADPQVYGPMVLASLRRAGDRWEQDLDKVRRRAEGKRAAHRASSVPITRPAGRRA